MNLKVFLTILWSVLALASFAYAFIVRAVDSGNKFFLFWIVAGCVFIFFTVSVRIQLWSKLPHILKTIFIVLVVLCATIFVIIEGMIISKFNSKADKDLDYVIVLGAQVKESGPSVVLKYRLDKALEYLNENPKTKCIVTGSQGANEPFTEAEGMADYLTSCGIKEDRIILEDKAENTAENIKYSMQVADLNNKNVAIITNNFHMFRALKISQKQGLVADGICASSTALYLPNNMVREFIGTLKDWIVGNLNLF